MKALVSDVDMDDPANIAVVAAAEEAARRRDGSSTDDEADEGYGEVTTRTRFGSVI